MAQKWENGQNISTQMGFRTIFPVSGPCFPYFRGEAKIHFSAIFFLFWAGGDSLPGRHVCKYRLSFVHYTRVSHANRKLFAAPMKHSIVHEWLSFISGPLESVTDLYLVVGMPRTCPGDGVPGHPGRPDLSMCIST